MTMKQNKEKFDFKAFGQAIKEAKRAKGILRNQLADRPVSYTHLDWTFPCLLKSQFPSLMFFGIHFFL